MPVAEGLIETNEEKTPVIAVVGPKPGPAIISPTFKPATDPVPFANVIELGEVMSAVPLKDIALPG